MRGACDGSIVGNYQHRSSGLRKCRKSIQDYFGVIVVKVAGGLIGEQEAGFVEKRPRQGDSLTFAGAELSGMMASSFGKIEQPDQFIRPAGSIVTGESNARSKNIVAYREIRYEMKLLKYESDSAGAETRPLIGGKSIGVDTVDRYTAFIGSKKAAGRQKQGRFAAATGALHSYEFTPGRGVRNVRKSAHDAPFSPVILAYPQKFNKRRGHRSFPPQNVGRILVGGHE